MNKKALVINGLCSLKDCVKNNPEFVNRATEIWNENNRLSKQIKILEVQNEAQMIKITEKYKLYRDILTAIFSERQIALAAHYRTLDNALENGDREVIIASLKGISSIVTQNPLESLAEFSKVLDNDNETLLLDF